MKTVQFCLLLCSVVVSACSSQMNDLLEPSALSPVGSGLGNAGSAEAVAAYPVAEQQKVSWIGGPSDLFRDRRAHNVGDILTVEIAINDKAALSNNSNQSRKSNSAGDLGLKYTTLGVVGPDLKGSGSLNSSSSSAGQGTTVRSENIELSVAAVVTAILPNGYLLIKGSQEIQVNYETRLLKISGVVHPTDIAENGKLSYDKIAEARISYGGKGSVSEIQKPGWGQELLNRLAPF
jgi:flagellar L-ring protein FlgH